MSENTRKILPEEMWGKVVERLAAYRLTGMFGDGQEEEYVMFGFPDMKGLRHMSHEELINELVSIADSEDDLVKEVRNIEAWDKFCREHFEEAEENK